VRAPTRALIVEDIGTWVYTFNRAARRAGARFSVTVNLDVKVAAAIAAIG